jgi:hypothetical protein
VVVRLGSVRAKVRGVGGQLVDFWDMWCQDVAEVAVGGKGIGYVAGVVVGFDEVFGYIAELEDWCLVDATFDLSEVVELAPPPFWLDHAAVVDMLAYWYSWTSGMSLKSRCVCI